MVLEPICGPWPPHCHGFLTIYFPHPAKYVFNKVETPMTDNTKCYRPITAQLLKHIFCFFRFNFLDIP